MKLLRCYIENFGKLTNFSMTFDQGINRFVEDNGWGKSTLAAFLRAMFYGMEQSRARGNERNRYEPWQGGRYGGYIVFESGGKTYRLERFFGKKEKEDSFVLRDDESGLESSDFSGNIGCELFGLDRESYAKSAYIAQGDAEIVIERAGNISAKLFDMADFENDMGSFDEAIRRLEKKKSEYGKKSGIVAAAKKEAEGLSDALEEEKGKEKPLAAIITRLDAMRREREEKGRQLKALQEARAVHERYERYRALADREEACRKRLKEVSDELLRVPEEEAMENIRALYKAWLQSCSVRDHEHLSKEQEDALDAFLEEGVPQPPSDGLAEEVHRCLLSYRSVRDAQKQAALTEEETQRMAELEAVVPPCEETDWDRLFSIPDDLAKLKDDLAKMDMVWLKKRQKRRRKAGVSGAIGLLLLTLGVAGFLSGGGILAFVLSGISLALFAAGGWMLLSGKKSAVDEERAALIKKQEELQQSLSAFLSSFGYEPDGKTAQHLSDVYAAVMEYTSLKQKKERYRRILAQGEAEEIEKRVNALVAPYIPPPPIEEAEARLHEYERRYQTYDGLKKAKERYLASVQRAEESYRALALSTSFYTDCEAKDAPEMLTKAVEKIRLAKEAYHEAENERNAFTADFGIPEVRSGEVPSEEEMEEVGQAIGRLDKDCLLLERQKDDLEASLERIPEMEERLDTAVLAWDAAKKKLSVVEAAQEELKGAKEALTTRYLGALRQAFSDNLALLASEGGALLDAQFHIDIEALGSLRPIEAYSEGTRDLFGIALRFALIEALFEKEAPVVILDDPFVNLDAVHLAAAQKFLQQLADRYQMIYLVCHESR